MTKGYTMLALIVRIDGKLKFDLNLSKNSLNLTIEKRNLPFIIINQ